MATTVKMMFNDKEAVLELAKDPEVQAKIKAAIVDEVAKRAAKAARAALENSIEEAVNLEVDRFNFPSARNPNNWFTRDNAWHRLTLKPDVREKIRDHVRAVLSEQMDTIVSSLPEMDEVRRELAKQVANVKGMNVEEMLKAEIERVVRKKFGGN